MCAPVRVCLKPCDLLECMLVILHQVPGCRTGTACVLPLSLTRKRVLLALLPAQPPTERHRIVPAHADHGVVVRLLEAGIPPVCGGVEFPGSILGVAPKRTGIPVFCIGLESRCLDELSELTDRDLAT